MFGVFEKFVTSWRFPVTVSAFLMSMVALMAAVFLIPDSGHSLSAFAQDFKVWCFGYNPDTGTVEWGYIWMFLVQPFVLLALVLIVWFNPVRDILKTRPTATLPYVVSAIMLTGVMATTFPSVGGSKINALLPFPGSDIRTERVAPDFQLSDQDGKAFSLDGAKGSVVLITAVYASCADTCPLILQQTRRVLKRLTPGQARSLQVIAITLDPTRDTPAILGNLLKVHRLDSLGVKALTGDMADVNSILDRYGFYRVRKPGTGMIEHSNRMIAIDRQGRIAYTFALGETQEEWMYRAIEELIDES